MAGNLVIKQNDTKIVFTDTPMLNGVPLDPSTLVGCTLAFFMKSTDPAVQPPTVVTGVGTINSDGTFSYTPAPADVANAGKFTQEWEVTYPGGGVLTFPNNGYNVVKILAEIG